MKKILLIFLAIAPLFVTAQDTVPGERQRKAIHALINKYSESREKRDTILLKSILMPEVDQLVSTGEWRNGIGASVKGMLASSASTPGTRTLTIDKIRFFNNNCGIVDCRYEIQNQDGTIRKMWSTFIVVRADGEWKISAIRNMLPGK